MLAEADYLSILWVALWYRRIAAEDNPSFLSSYLPSFMCGCCNRKPVIKRFNNWVRHSLYGCLPMFVQLSGTPVDYGRLLKQVDRSTSAFPPLLNAHLQLDTTA